MATTLQERLTDPGKTSPLSLTGLVPKSSNRDANILQINDSFELGSYDETLRPDDAKAASRITPLPKRP